MTGDVFIHLPVWKGQCRKISEISQPYATNKAPQIFQSWFYVWLGILADSVREWKEFFDRMQNIIKRKRIEFYERESSFSTLQDESHESESLLKVSWPGKVAATATARAPPPAIQFPVGSKIKMFFQINPSNYLSAYWYKVGSERPVWEDQQRDLWMSWKRTGISWWGGSGQG